MQQDKIIPPAISWITDLLSSYLSDKKIIEISFHEEDRISLLFLDGSKRNQYVKLTKKKVLWFGKCLAIYTGQQFSARHPSLAAKLPGKEARVQMKVPTRTNKDISLCIRLGIGKKIKLGKYFPSKSDREEFLDLLLSKKCFLILGSTGSGKTTFANSIIEYLPKDERIVTVEDTHELLVLHKDHFSIFVSRSGSDESGGTEIKAIDDALRLNPKRLILGEISSRNASAFLTAIKLGTPAFTTIH